MIRESEERNASDDAKSNEENLILYPVIKGRLQSMIDILKSLYFVSITILQHEKSAKTCWNSTGIPKKALSDS